MNRHRVGSLRCATARGGILAGCLIALIVLIGLVIGAGIYAYMNWRTWAADGTISAAHRAMAKAELSDEQEAAIMVEVNELADGIRSGDVSPREILRVGEELLDGPLPIIVAVNAAQDRYIEDSGLTDDEKENAYLQMQRLARGVFNDTINVEEFEEAVDEIAVRTDKNTWTLRDPEIVSDDDLRSMIGEITTLADAKDIPAEPFEPDIAAEIGEAIDRALGNAPDDDPPEEAPAQEPPGSG